MIAYDVFVNGRKDLTFEDGLLARQRMDVIDRTCRKKKPVAMVVHIGQVRTIHFKSGRKVRIEIRKTEGPS